jgi:hypothetical protein
VMKLLGAVLGFELGGENDDEIKMETDAGPSAKKEPTASTTSSKPSTSSSTSFKPKTTSNDQSNKLTPEQKQVRGRSEMAPPKKRPFLTPHRHLAPLFDQNFFS